MDRWAIRILLGGSGFTPDISYPFDLPKFHAC